MVAERGPAAPGVKVTWKLVELPMVTMAAGGLGMLVTAKSPGLDPPKVMAPVRAREDSLKKERRVRKGPVDFEADSFSVGILKGCQDLPALAIQRTRLSCPIQRLKEAGLPGR